MREIRGITVLAMLCALTAAGFATGKGDGARSYTATFDMGGEVSLRLNAKGRKVSQIAIDRITAECRRGSATLYFDISGTTPVRDDRSFAVRSTDRKAKAFVKGRFSSGYRVVKGTARVHGKILRGKPRCDSKRQKFEGKVNG